LNQLTWSERLLAPFSRRTSSGRYVREIDGLRCLAIVLVVLFHQHHLFLEGGEYTTATELVKAGWSEGLQFLPNFFIAKGWFGVQIFFVISGMVLALPFAGHHLRGEQAPGLKDYFIRRLIRIEIPYLITLTVMFFWIIIFNGGSFWGNLPHYGAGLVYLHNIIYDGALNPVLSVSWTLELEIQFYLIAPLLCRVFCIKNRWLRRGLLLTATLVATPLFEMELFSLFKNTLLPRLEYFLAGMLLADFYLLRESRESKRHWDIAGLLAWPAVFLLIEHHFPINPKPIILMLGFWAVLHGPLLSRLFSNLWVTAIGTMCYTIYLFHNFAIYGIFNHHVFGPIIPVTKGNWPWNTALMLLMAALVISFCALIFLVIEKPFMRGKLPKFLTQSKR